MPHTERFPYDMSHYINTCGQIGMLQTMKINHVVAGESRRFAFNGQIRQSPLTRHQVLDGIADFWCFYMPYRRIYGDDWKEFIKEGVNENVTFPTGPAIDPQTPPNYLGFPGETWETNVRLDYVATYNRIFNWYFRNRSDKSGKADTLVYTGARTRMYGHLIGRLPSQWSEILHTDNLPNQTDREVSSATVLDIVDFAKQQGIYESEVLRTWFADEYQDVIEKNFRGNVLDDSEDKPELVWHHRMAMSGYDVDGTAGDSLGQYGGKSVANVNYAIPRKFFPEHGLVFHCATMRYPTIHHKEVNRLAKVQQFDYEEISGDPRLLENSEPVEFTREENFANTTGSGTVLGMVPAGYHYRSEQSATHSLFDAANGYPFIEVVPGTKEDASYHTTTEFDDVFQSTQLGHYQIHLLCQADTWSTVPPARESIFAGTRK